MSRNTVFHWGKSTRVTLSSREVTQLKNVSRHIKFMLCPEFRNRWLIPRNILPLPEEITKEHLLILAGRWKVRKGRTNVYEFVRALHYLEVDELKVLQLLRITCYRCNLSRCNCSLYFSYDLAYEGCYFEEDFIPVLYFLYYIAQWQVLYSAILTFLSLCFVKVDSSWPYHKFKRYIRAMFRSRDRWFDESRFLGGELRRQSCAARGCVLCQTNPKDEDGDGWRF